MADHRNPTTFAYGGPGIDRVSLWRSDDARIQSLMKDKNARFIPVWKQGHLLVRTGDEGPRPRYLSFEEADAYLTPKAVPPVFLGIHDDKPWFALGLPASETSPLFGEGQFEGLRDIVALLTIADASLLAYARAMVIWHENHKFCGRCGAETDTTEAGHSRTCTNSACRHRSFPRTDPVVITLVAHPDGERALLGRQPHFPPGFYSCVAGFVEPGESLEAAVARETREETGIDIGEVAYMASQPWPFPASIMLGFHAQAVTTDIHMDDEELEDCRWFTRSELRAASEGFEGTSQGLRLAPPTAIARFLIDAWLKEK